MTRAHKWLTRSLKTILLLVVAVVVAAVGLAAWAIHRLEKVELFDTHNLSYDRSLDVVRTAPNGARFTVNNSKATFSLDLRPTDRHSERLFKSYEEARQYCVSNGLAFQPSVEMVIGKCKAVNDRVVIALERAVAEGRLSAAVPGKQAALERLAKVLLKRWHEADDASREGVTRALAHVAGAARLGRRGSPTSGTADGEDRLPEVVERTLADAVSVFLAKPIESRPIGFWAESPELSTTFVRDRFLMQGFSLADDTPPCIELAMAVQSDAELSRAFGFFGQFHARLTNPPAYKGLHPCPSIFEIARLWEKSADLPQRVDRLAWFRREAALMYGEHAGMALDSYSTSPEAELVVRVVRATGIPDPRGFLDRILAMIRSGEFSLEPGPDSGWYAYQWYALETLICPDRAAENPKLLLNRPYRKRFEEIFASAVTKNRETHILSVPTIIGGLSGDDIEASRRKVEVRPEFTVEPAATVYLRQARGYRFLRAAIGELAGEGGLERLQAKSSGGEGGRATVASELEDIERLMYGLRECLSYDLGLAAVYSEGEMDADVRTRARKAARSWIAALGDDPDLNTDVRVVVPMMKEPSPGGVLQNWGVAGIRLIPARYEYLEEPTVSGAEPLLRPSHVYLPADSVVMFRRSEPPLTRAEFRALCDRAGSDRALRRLLGAVPSTYDASRMAMRFWTWSAGIVALPPAVLWWIARRFPASRRRIWACVRMTLVSAVSVLLIWALAIALLPGYRIRFLVRHVAPRSHGAAEFVQGCVFFIRGPLRQGCQTRTALVAMLDDSDCSSRSLAAEYLLILHYHMGHQDRVKYASKDIDRLRAAASDRDARIAEIALCILADICDPGSYLVAERQFLERGDDPRVGPMALYAMVASDSARALPHVLKAARGSRPHLRPAAIYQLGGYHNEPAVTGALIELMVDSSLSGDRVRAARAAQSLIDRDPPEQVPRREELRQGLIDVISDTTLGWVDWKPRRQCLPKDATDGERAAACRAVLMSEAVSRSVDRWVLKDAAEELVNLRGKTPVADAAIDEIRRTGAEPARLAIEKAAAIRE